MASMISVLFPSSSERRIVLQSVSACQRVSTLRLTPSLLSTPPFGRLVSTLGPFKGPRFSAFQLLLPLGSCPDHVFLDGFAIVALSSPAERRSAPSWLTSGGEAGAC